MAFDKLREDNMENEKNEQVIFIKDLLFAALYQWRRIVVFALLFGLLLGGVAAAGEFKKASAVIPQETIGEAMLAYEEALEKLEARIEKVNAQIETHETYLAESVLLNADPYNLYRANVLLAVEGTEDPSSILRAYLLYLSSKELYAEANKELDIPANSLTELITTERDEQNPKSVQITITCATEESARVLLELVNKHMLHAEAEIKEKIGVHSLGILSGEVFSCVDTKLADARKQAEQQRVTLKDSLQLLEKEKSALAEPKFGAAAFSKKKVVLFAVIGAVLGGMMVVGVACLYHIAGGKVYSARTLGNKTGLNALGVIPGETRKNPIDRWLTKLEGRATQAQKAEVAICTVCNYCADGKKLLIVGDCGNALQPVADALKNKGVDVIAAGDLLTDPQTVTRLPGCDVVLLAEKCGVSNYANVMQSLALISDRNKPVIGFVLMEK